MWCRGRRGTVNQKTVKRVTVWVWAGLLLVHKYYMCYIWVWAGLTAGPQIPRVACHGFVAGITTVVTMVMTLLIYGYMGLALQYLKASFTRKGAKKRISRLKLIIDLETF